MEFVLPCMTYDLLVIWWRRKVNYVNNSYPYAKIYSCKRSKSKYCVVRYTMPNMLLFAAGTQFLFKYYWLRERGYVSIIDIEYTESFGKGKIGENNIWDSCFEQPILTRKLRDEAYVIACGEGFNPPDDTRICKDLNNDEADHFIHVKEENFREYYKKAKIYVSPFWKIRNDIMMEYEEGIGKNYVIIRCWVFFCERIFLKTHRLLMSVKQKQYMRIIHYYHCLKKLWKLLKKNVHNGILIYFF